MTAQSNKVWTLSNALSFARAVLAWPIVASLMIGTRAGDIQALVLMLLAGLTDFFDGYLARKFNQTSDVGRIIDPLADKICVVAIAVTLMFTHGLPMWFLILIIARDLAILLLGTFMISHTKSIPESNWPGKVTVTVLAMVLIVYTLSLDPLKMPVLVAGVAVVLISTVSYFKRFIKEIFTGKK